MLSRWPIRYKLWFGFATLFLSVAILSFSGFRGVYAYRHVAKSISRRAAELPLAAELTRSVSDLQHTAARLHPKPNMSMESTDTPQSLRETFRAGFQRVTQALQRYRDELDNQGVSDTLIDDNRDELKTVREIEASLGRIAALDRDEDWVFAVIYTHDLDDELASLNHLTSSLPGFLHKRMQNFVVEVRGEYRTWIYLTWITTVISGVLLGWLTFLFYRWVFAPLRVLIDDSRRIAGGDFDHRIELNTHDEIAELGASMNAMTGRFREIRDNLDQLVQARTHELEERTQQLVRSEQLASVGFLAAGVSHEINNPLASIQWCAESLESRLYDILQLDETQSADERNPEIAVLRKYLKTIQDESFRCKGITEKLLDFSRAGHVERHATDLRELVQSVIDIVQTIARYKGKPIEFACREHVVAAVNAQELKQVTLNLITNALDSLDSSGKVTIELRRTATDAELTVTDTGCGMTSEVMQNLFQPFFTRRRDGQGTGLGLSISHRIVDEHHGTIQAFSAGPGQGSRMRMTVPLIQPEKHHEKRYAQVA